MWAQYVVNQPEAGADAAQLQEKWLSDLKDFVTRHPKSSDSAEAMLQLGMHQEFIGKPEEATKWYQQLVTNFRMPRLPPRPAAPPGGLTSVGKPLPFKVRPSKEPRP